MALAPPSALTSRFHGDDNNGFEDDDQWTILAEKAFDSPSQAEHLPQHESATDCHLDEACSFSNAQSMPHMAQRESSPHDLQSQMSHPLRKRKRLYPCAVCTANGGKSFKTSNDLDRHNRSVYGLLKDGDRFWMCPVNGCVSAGKSWTRLDNFKSHVLTMHGQRYESHIDGASHVFDAQKDDARIVTMRTRCVKSDSHDSGISISSAHSHSQPDLAAVGNLFSDISLELSQSPPTIRVQRGVSPIRGLGASRIDTGPKSKRPRVKSPLRPSTWQQSDGSATGPHLQLTTPRSPGRDYLSPRLPSAPETAESPRSDGERSFVGMSADEDNDDSSVLLTSVETQLADHLARLVHVSYRKLNGANRLPLRCHPTGGNRSAGQRQNHNGRPQQSRSARSSRKRARTTGSQSGPGNDDGDKDTHEKQPEDGRQVVSEGTLSPDQKTFACPYHKADPFKYSELNSGQQEYRTYGVCTIRNIQVLKQHLYRHRSRPKH